ncbi:unnamed protein product [Camellia sinensis]
MAEIIEHCLILPDLAALPFLEFRFSRLGGFIHELAVWQTVKNISRDNSLEILERFLSDVTMFSIFAGYQRMKRLRKLKKTGGFIEFRHLFCSWTDKVWTSEKVGMGAESDNWHLELTHDQWVALSVSGPRPPARYKHAAAVVDEKLYIFGGSRNGRYLSDTQVFDLKTLAWSTLNLNTESNADKIKDSLLQEVLPATSGHRMIKWGNKLLLLGGHSKYFSDSITVQFIDLESHQSGVMETTGKVPVSRSGQSVTLVGSRLIMFGGEDLHRQLMNDVHVLDLETMTWDILETTQTPPAPRFDHTAAVHVERYLLIFGGCSHSIFFNDLHVLDLQTRLTRSHLLQLEWSQPQIQGDLVAPRAGHAGITIDENWYIVGGGDNKSGASETLVLNMSKLAMSMLTNVKDRDPLASEGYWWLYFSFLAAYIYIVFLAAFLAPLIGLSVSSAVVDSEKILVAFGGYNGKYNNEVFVMRLKPRDSPHPKIFQSPAAAAAAASVTAAYALTHSGKSDFNKTEHSNIKVIQNNGSQHDLSIDINAIREEKTVLESALEEVRAENSILKGKVNETTSTYADLSKELHSVQVQLAAERSRCVTLEAQIGEVQKMLESLKSIEEEIQLLGRQKSALESDVELSGDVQRQSSGGVWKWIAQ